MGFISLDYALESYSLEKALLWGNFKAHCQEAIKLNDSRKFVHIAIAIVEFFPFIGQIASLFEYAIVQRLREPNNAAATSLQSGIRSFMAKQKIENLKLELEQRKVISAVSLQNFFRSYFASDELERRKQQKVNAITTLQNSCRSYLANQRLKELELKNASSIVIQSYSRKFLAEQKLKQAKEQRVQAAITFQNFCRRFSAEGQFLKLQETYHEKLTAVMAEVNDDCFKSIFSFLDVQSAFDVLITSKKCSFLVMETFRDLMKLNFANSTLSHLNPIIAYQTHKNRQQGEITREIEYEGDCGVRSVAFSSTNLLAIGSRDITIWQNDIKLDTIEFKGYEVASNIHFSQDNSKLTFRSQYQWFLYDLSTKKLNGCGEGYNLKFSPNGLLLITDYSRRSRDFRVINTSDDTTMMSFCYPRNITCANFSPDNKILAIAFQEKLCKSENLSTDSDDDAEELEIASGLGICLWDLENRCPKLILKGHDKKIISLAFSPDGNTLATIDQENLHLWNLQDSKNAILEKSFTFSASNYVDRVHFSPDGNTIAVKGCFTALIHRNTPPGPINEDEFSFVNVRFSPCSQYFISYVSRVELRETSTKKRIKVLYKCEKDYKIESACFSNDGTQIAIVCYKGGLWGSDGKAILLDFKPQKPS